MFMACRQKSFYSIKNKNVRKLAAKLPFLQEIEAAQI